MSECLMRKRMLCLVLALALLATPARASQSGDVVAQALSQMGVTEGEDEYTVYGERYGYPHGYWCDMFVSWCADEAGVSREAFPRSVNCARHTRAFTALGRYYESAARGGTYVPQQGDLVLFYSYDKDGRIHHVGLVLYVEDEQVFTVEGNALTGRLDYPAGVVSEARIPEIEPNDYVTANHYCLEDPRIHGYAVPAYTSREPLELEGFVDLGRYSDAEEAINFAASSGLIPPTSSHTFSPRAGMARGEFLQSALSLCGLFGWEEGTPAYDDVPPESVYYSAAMTARSAGLLPETGENLFQADRWISGEEAQAILSGVARCLGAPEREFEFTSGDLSQVLTPYTTRGDLAQALYSLCGQIPQEQELLAAFLTLWGKILEWPARMLEGVCYVPAASLLACFPELNIPGPVPAGEAGQREVTLKTEGRALRSRGFLWNNTLYVPLADAAGLLRTDFTGAERTA